MMKYRTPLFLGLAAAIMAASPAMAEGDVKAGKKVFRKCKACHWADKAKNKVGPHLVGLFGREAGALEDFKYSDAMKESGIVWDAETLIPYLKKPKEAVPGTKMAFAGLKKDQQIADVIAYLEEATVPPSE